MLIGMAALLLLALLPALFGHDSRDRAPGRRPNTWW